MQQNNNKYTLFYYTAENNKLLDKCKSVANRIFIFFLRENLLTLKIQDKKVL